MSGCKTSMERCHHLTASLYFGIAALESFLNEKMRAHLKRDQIRKMKSLTTYCKGQILTKLKK